MSNISIDLRFLFYFSNYLLFHSSSNYRRFSPFHHISLLMDHHNHKKNPVKWWKMSLKVVIDKHHRTSGNKFKKYELAHSLCLYHFLLRDTSMIFG